jgi:hypothetical protein
MRRSSIRELGADVVGDDGPIEALPDALDDIEVRLRGLAHDDVRAPMCAEMSPGMVLVESHLHAAKIEGEAGLFAGKHVRLSQPKTRASPRGNLRR